MLIAVGAAVLMSALSSAGRASVVPAAAASRAPDPRPAVLVHVLGEVRRPGIYTLGDGARVVDAIAAAGGFTDRADGAAVNLARRVADGEQLRVPAVGEGPAATGAAPGRIDLNSATAEQLATLPRIGPAMAARIVEWREKNGGFSSADDLLDVPGLGDKTVAQLRDLVLP